MRLTERVLAEQRRIKQQEDQETDRQQEQDEDEMGLAYEERPARGPLNLEPGAFVKKGMEGINTKPDIFERTTVFHVSSRRS